MASNDALDSMSNIDRNITGGEKSKLATQVAGMGMPPLRINDGLVELSIQPYRAKRRFVIENYPAPKIPKVGDDIKLPNRNGERTDTFVVIEVKHLLVPRVTETIRAVLLLVKRSSRV